MTLDFRANQLRGNKLISSGSTGTNAKFLVYDISADSISNPNQGSIDPTKFGTGSIGNDIFLYVSGTAISGSSAGAISVFGGSVKVSGTLNIITNLTVQGTGSFGSLQTNVFAASNLSGTTVTGTWVSGTYLSGTFANIAQISGTFISGTNISGTNFFATNISGTVVSATWISGTYLSGTFANFAQMSGTFISGTNISGTNLFSTRISGTVITGTWISGTYLSGTFANIAQLSGTFISGTNISGTNFFSTRVSGTVLTGTWVSGTYFSGTFGNFAQFSGTFISGTNISGTNFFSTNISGTFLTASFALVGSITGANIFGAAVNPVSRSSTAGTSGTFARADHVHDGGKASITYITGNYTILAEDEFLLISMSSPISFSLPVLTDNRTFLLKKIDTGTNDILLSASSPNNIENAGTSYTLTGSSSPNRPAWTLLYHVSQSRWWVL